MFNSGGFHKYNLGVRWFTREHHEAPDFDDWDALRAAYRAYIDSIRGGLPPDLQRLTGMNLHDALIDIADLDLVRHTAHIRLLTGDSAEFIDCQYEEADFGMSNLRNFQLAIEARVPRRDMSGAVVGWQPLATVLHDEITQVGDRFQHAFLIDPLGDFAVSFRGFTLGTQAAPGGGLPERSERFRIVNQWSE